MTDIDSIIEAACERARMKLAELGIENESMVDSIRNMVISGSYGDSSLGKWISELIKEEDDQSG